VSRLKVELGVSADEVAADPDAGPAATAFVAYERAVAASGGLDFDDLILRAIAVLEREPALLARWRSSCRELLVDEVQDVDRAQLGWRSCWPRPIRIFLVGDDDQSIYGWRLADVRRILARRSSPASVGSISRSTIDARGRSSNAPSGWSSTTPSASRRSSGPGLARPGG
jgi:superfamily I DNA/RNA helicase